MKLVFQHYFNAMHIYCLLVRFGVGKKLSLSLARRWEKSVHSILY